MSSVAKIARSLYIRELEEQGYIIEDKTTRFADIIAHKNGEDFYFEIKATSASDRYFGAATLTEVNFALKHPDRYRFVIIRLSDSSGDSGICSSKELSVEDLLKLSSIPPFKVYFNYPLGEKRKKKSKAKSGVQKRSVENMVSFYETEFRKSL